MDNNFLVANSGQVIILEASIACGKSTLGKNIESYLRRKGLIAKYLPEFFNKPLLDYYIKNMKTQAYSFQIIMSQVYLSFFRYLFFLIKHLLLII